MKAFRQKGYYLLFFFFIGFLASPVVVSASKITDIKNIRVWRSPEKTRLVFDLSGRVEHKIFSLENPGRLVIDINAADMKIPQTEFAKLDFKHSPITELRTAKRNKSDVRVVLDLNSTVKARSFVLLPNEQYSDRLVVDLYDHQKKQQPAVVVKSKPPEISAKRDIIVAIDAGHGGEDPGAIGFKKTKEKNVVLPIAKKLEKLFLKTKGFKPVLIRKGDYYIGLRERSQKARDHRADLFISIHADGFTNPNARGASVYALSTRGSTSEMARWMAMKQNKSDLVGGVGGVSLTDKAPEVKEILLDLSRRASLGMSLEVGKKVLMSMGEATKLHGSKPRVEQASFLVLKSPDIPSILVETGYISNPKEEKLLKDRKFQQKMASAIHRGVEDYFASKPPPGTYLSWLKEKQQQLAKKHTIKRGDTLTRIAKLYGVSIASIRKANSLRSDSIKPGQILTIPVL